MDATAAGRSRTQNHGNVEDVVQLDIRQLHRLNVLRPQQLGSVSIPCRNQRPVNVTICGDPSGQAIWVRDPRIGSSAHIRLTIEWRPCRFGGRRPLFRCPACDRPTLGLFRSFYKWWCRRCAHLSYESQNQGELDRAVARVNALRWELDPADPGFDVNVSAFRDSDRIPKRPKGMRLETYQRILEWIREGEQEARVLLFKKLRLLPIHEPKGTRTRQRNRSRR